MSTKIKSYCDGFVIRLGPMQTTGRLMPLFNSSIKKETKFFSVTPDGNKVSQRYIDDAGNLFKPGELKKGMVNPDDGHVVIVDPADYKAATASPLPKNVMNLTVHDSAECDQKLIPAKSQVLYVFEPDTNDPMNVKWYDLFVASLERTDKTFVGVVNLQNNEGVFRLFNWQGNLVVQKQTPPNELYRYNPPTPEVEEAEVEGVLGLVNKLAAPFDPDQYSNQQIERIKALQEAAVEGVELKPVVSPVASTVDILSILDDFEV